MICDPEMTELAFRSEDNHRDEAIACTHTRRICNGVRQVSWIFYAYGASDNIFAYEDA